MKNLVVLITLIGISLAIKPQRFNDKFTRFQRLQNFQPPLARQEQQQPVPHDVYGPPPSNQYGPPPNSEYGPPPPSTSELPSITTTELPTTTESQSEQVNTTSRFTKPNKNQGVYYIYHPTGLLQRVVYSTKKDARNMAYTAQVKYEDVDPIKAPIFTYDPQTLVLNRLQL